MAAGTTAEKALFPRSEWATLGTSVRSCRLLASASIEAFGAERIMWASDMGGNQTGETWEQLLHYLLDSDGITDEEKAWLFGRAVRTLLDWPI